MGLRVKYSNSLPSVHLDPDILSLQNSVVLTKPSDLAVRLYHFYQAQLSCA